MIRKGFSIILAVYRFSRLRVNFRSNTFAQYGTPGIIARF